MPVPAAPALILAAGPDAPGARAAVAAAASGRPHVLLTGTGLAWLAEPAALALLRAASADLALCGASARDRGLSAAATPEGVRWSSVATWLAQRGSQAFAMVLP